MKLEKVDQGALKDLQVFQDLLDQQVWLSDAYIILLLSYADWFY